MTFTTQVTGGAEREVYGGLPACEQYILDMVGDGATAFRALVPAGDDRKRLLIEATRFIDRQDWVGEPNFAGPSVLKWPRDGITDAEGAAVGNADQLALIEQAVFELVAILAEDNDAKSAADQGQNIKSMGAGTGRMEFFAPTKTDDGSATKLPTVLDELIGKWLKGSGGAQYVAVGGFVTGTCGESSFDKDDDADLAGPL